MEKLTKRQNDTLNIIKKFIAENGCSPTIREIATNLNLSSPATIHTHIKELENKGYIRKKNNKNRTIELLVANEYDKKGLINIPLLDNSENIEKYISIPCNLVENNNHTFAIIIDQSINNKIFFPNDIVIFKKSHTIENDDIILTSDNNTLEITKYNKNSSYKIIGKAICMYRTF